MNGHLDGKGLRLHQSHQCVPWWKLSSVMLKTFFWVHSLISETWGRNLKCERAFCAPGFLVQLCQSDQCNAVWIFSISAPETGPVHISARFTHPVTPGGHISGLSSAAGGQSVHQRVLCRNEQKLHKIHSPQFSRSVTIYSDCDSETVNKKAYKCRKSHLDI